MNSIPSCEPILGEIEKTWLLRCIDSGFVSSVGPMISQFENAFAAAVNMPHAVSAASGTAALHVALHALGIGPGDRVAVSDLTFIASMNPILYCGATPVLIDAHPDTWCMDLDLLERTCRDFAAQGAPLKAVIPVHIYGLACDMPRLVRLAQQYNFRIVEDATEALGASIDAQPVGAFGTIGCFSFNGNKMITTGAGGMLVTRSEPLAKRLRYLVNQARDDAPGYVHGEMGFNYRLSNLAAALGMAQMERLEPILSAKRAIAQRYRDGLADLPGLTLHPEPPTVEGGFWLYSILFDSPSARDACVETLEREGIAARPFFTPLHQQAYARSFPFQTSSPNMPVSESLARRGLNLPSSASLTPADQSRIIHILRTHT